MNNYPYRPKLGGFDMNKRMWEKGYRNRQVQFLDSSKRWDPLRGEWQPRKILGFGTFGVVIQFEYTGSDPNMPKFMAVKQSSGDDLEQESIALQRIAVTGTDHVVKLYKAVHKDDGAGILGAKDPLPVPPKNRQVSRIYMEFAGQADMDTYMKRKEQLGEVMITCAIPEEHLWRIMHCLARGFLVLATGSEDPKKPNVEWGRPIIHFDVKPANILIGERDRDEHKRINIFKLTDFGLALRRPDIRDGDITKNKLWIANTAWRATPGYAAPEQEIPNHFNRRIDSPTGIYSLGVIFYNMLLGDLISETPERFYYRIPGRMSFMTHGSQLINHDYSVPYSTHLINTVLRCLAYDPSDRPSAFSLVQETQQVLEFWNNLQKDEPYPVETMLDDRVRSKMFPGAVNQDDQTPVYQSVDVKIKPQPAETPIPDLDPTPNIPTNPLIFDQRPPEDTMVALARYAANLQAAELAAGVVPAKDPEIDDDPARVAKQLELDAKLKQEADVKSAARKAQVAAEVKKQTDDVLAREINNLTMGAPLTRFGPRGAIMRPRSLQANSNYQTAKPMTAKAAEALLGLLKPPAPPKTFKQRADATIARLEVQQERVDIARDILGDPAFEAKVKNVLKRLSPNKLQRLPGQEDVTYKADVDFAQRQRAEMIVSGQGDPDGGPDPRGFLERVMDDWLKRAWVGTLPILGGFNFGDDDDPMDES